MLGRYELEVADPSLKQTARIRKIIGDWPRCLGTGIREKAANTGRSLALRRLGHARLYPAGCAEPETLVEALVRPVRKSTTSKSCTC